MGVRSETRSSNRNRKEDSLEFLFNSVGQNAEIRVPRPTARNKVLSLAQASPELRVVLIIGTLPCSSMTALALALALRVVALRTRALLILIEVAGFCPRVLKPTTPLSTQSSLPVLSITLLNTAAQSLVFSLIAFSAIARAAPGQGQLIAGKCNRSAAHRSVRQSRLIKSQLVILRSRAIESIQY